MGDPGMEGAEVSERSIVTPSDDVRFAVPDLEASDLEAVTRVLRSGWITTGEEALQLEAELSERLGGLEVVSVSSCTAALEIALAALDLPPGARVGVPTWTFVSSALAAVRVGAVPVLVDVDPATLCLDPDALQAELDRGLDAVVAVHFGGSAFARSIIDRCAAAGVPLVEDAAHALGATDHRGPIGGRGTAGAALSFYATKNLTSAEGGALVTDDADLARFARSYRLHGLSADAWARYKPGRPQGYDLIAPGIKANLPDLLAALARSQFARFDDLQARRRVAVEAYRAGLAATDGLADVTPLPRTQDLASADHLFVVELPAGTDRSAVAAGLARRGIGSSVHFRPLHTFEWFRDHAQVGVAGLAGADSVAERALSLPLHPGIAPADVERVLHALDEALHA